MDESRLLSQLPKVDVLLAREDVSALIKVYGRGLVVDAVRDALDESRTVIMSAHYNAERDDGLGAELRAAISPDEIVVCASRLLYARTRRSLCRVINATGIIVHTNLGRSLLAESAAEAVFEVARSYSTLEYDVENAERGSRYAHVEKLLCQLTGAEAAMVVNNNAAAVLLGLAGLARGKEAIVSRGELVEIGGSFRIPDIMAESGAKMVEVGATNKTHLKDYEGALNDNTGVMLKVHTSNYRVVGFTEDVSLEELVDLGAHNAVPVMVDEGSGVLLDIPLPCFAHEPCIFNMIRTGVSLVTFSGDKLLGGPQVGILAGRHHIISSLKKHPLTRALRLDKMTLAALEVTLRLYLNPDRACQEIPTLRMLSMTEAEVADRARRLAIAIEDAAPGAYSPAVMGDVSRAGGGALPMADIPTTVVALTPAVGSVNGLEKALRLGKPHVIARIRERRLILDPRTLSSEEEEREVVSALRRIAAT
ncbi:MAG: L-seryl-tRNA(Sec) selenium transferase [Coriobacteriia bacterium]|nr:L-seryl-tRNA(Sec) selenium transferase [Coriobacteriia bacterium]